MSAHIIFTALDPKHPATLSPQIMTDLLRTHLQFKGLALTDDLEMHAIIDHYGIEDAAVRSIQAGADIVLIGKTPELQLAAMEAVYQAVKNGIISKLQFEHALLRVLETKERFLIPYKAVDAKTAATRVGTHQHRDVAHAIKEAAAQPIV